MADPRRVAPAVVLAVSCLLAAGPATAATEDCGGGRIVLQQAEGRPRTIVGAVVTDVGPACDGQPIGVQFLGNEAGDPAAPAVELSRAYSDEDPCTGADVPDGVLRGGTVEVSLCDGSTVAGHVDGKQLTRLRLITTAGVVDPVADPDPLSDPDPVSDPEPQPPAGPAGPDPAPGADLPVTGADLLRALVLGAALVLGGGALLRGSRRVVRRVR